MPFALVALNETATVPQSGPADWWLVWLALAGLVVNALLTIFLIFQQRAVARNQEAMSKFTREQALGDEPKPEVLPSRDPFRRVVVGGEGAYHLDFILVNRGRGPTSIESAALYFPNKEEPGEWHWLAPKILPLDPKYEWKGQGHYTLPPGTRRSFTSRITFTPAERKAMLLPEGRPYVRIKMVVGEIPAFLLGDVERRTVTSDARQQQEAAMADKFEKAAGA